MHAHKCKACNFIWFHNDANAGNVQSHTCPNCGKVEWEQYQHRSGELPSPPQPQAVPQAAPVDSYAARKYVILGTDIFLAIAAGFVLYAAIRVAINVTKGDAA